jgi:hypothetical protein
MCSDGNWLTDPETLHHAVVDHSALASIERGILVGENIADLLRKVVIFSGQMDSTDLRAWAMSELRGYAEGVTIPSYRKVLCPIHADSIVGNTQWSGHNIEPWEIAVALKDVLPDFVFEPELGLRQPIAELQAYAAKNKDTRFQAGWSGRVAKRFDRGQPMQRTSAIYYVVSPASLRGVIDQVATELANFVSELRMTMPADQQEPTREAVSNAVNVTINGGTNSFTTGTNSPANQTNFVIARGDRGALIDTLTQLGVPEAELQELNNALDDSSEDPELPTSSVQGWMQRAKSGTMSGGGKILTGAAGGLAARALAMYFGWS